MASDLPGEVIKSMVASNLLVWIFHPGGSQLPCHEDVKAAHKGVHGQEPNGQHQLVSQAVSHFKRGFSNS